MGVSQVDFAAGAGADKSPLLTVSTGDYGPDGVVVSVAGEADVMTSPILRSALFDLGEQPGPDVLLDLRGVTFMDSTAISTLVAARRFIAGRGGELTLVYGDGPVARVLGLTKLDTVFRTRREPAASD